MNEKIKDEAREKIAKEIERLGYDEYGCADQILSLSGETDEVCDACEGTGRRRTLSFPQDQVGMDGGICFICNGTGKESWYIDVIRGKRPSGI